MSASQSPQGLPRHLDPWPHDSLEEHGRTFDPNRPRFADVPVITMTADGATLTRGRIADEELLAWLLEALPRSLQVGQSAGVFLFREGDRWDAFAEGSDVATDWRIMRRIEPAEQLSGSADLNEFLEKVSEMASVVRGWLDDGWTQEDDFDLEGVIGGASAGQGHVRAADRLG